MPSPVLPRKPPLEPAVAQHHQDREMQPRQVFFGDRPPAPTEEGRERSRAVARRLGQPAEQPSLDILGLLAILERGRDCGGVGGLEQLSPSPRRTIRSNRSGSPTATRNSNSAPAENPTPARGPSAGRTQRISSSASA